MPCVNAAAKRERDEFILKNRREVNEFDGVTDPVEILKIIHRPRKHDPLVNLIAYPRPVAEVYHSLTNAEADQLAESVATLVGAERRGEAESILRCLAAFTPANLEECLRAVVAHGSPQPCLAFHRAPADVRDDLIRRVEWDAEQRNAILLALAWIGDATVVNLFNLWRCEPPSWRTSLFCAPQDYSKEAGWDLTRNGVRRDLYFQQCTALMKRSSSDDRVHETLTKREDSCPWCGSALTNLFVFDGAQFDLAKGLNAHGRIQVATCQICTCFGTIYGSLDEEGRGRWSSKNERPDYLPENTKDWGRLPENALVPGGRRSPLSAADQFLPTTFSQIGGHPAWVQDAQYPECPHCRETMMFVAQIDQSEIDRGLEGTYYAFLCELCRTTATSYQQT